MKILQFRWSIIFQYHQQHFDFGLVTIEVNEIKSLMQNKIIEAKDNSDAVFNIGKNYYEASVQNLFHCHVHLILRRKSDFKNMRKVIRHVV
jgi:ATP adenylyltransferase